jgi:hypothetical protein
MRRDAIPEFERQVTLRGGAGSHSDGDRCECQLVFPDLSDPMIRALPIHALAIAMAIVTPWAALQAHNRADSLR